MQMLQSKQDSCAQSPVSISELPAGAADGPGTGTSTSIQILVDGTLERYVQYGPNPGIVRHPVRGHAGRMDGAIF